MCVCELMKTMDNTQHGTSIIKVEIPAERHKIPNGDVR